MLKGLPTLLLPPFHSRGIEEVYQYKMTFPYFQAESLEELHLMQCYVLLYSHILQEVYHEYVHNLSKLQELLWHQEHGTLQLLFYPACHKQQ